ncbi:hypothetical protein PMIN06_007631 [Paraphaeosphaeria minitans]|uniref:SNARE domain-containing protein n=1 Tax=Paraphaeosphaeria minitans TaxID=565426 RepID=A0A9P6GSU5_9PLEO|nr:SNARE domain-containing protein [Paraphaeosphaeria minitans]
MSTTNPPQLFLLADHIKLSLLERQRAISLNLSHNSQDSQISRSLEQLRSGIEALESQIQDVSDDSIASQLPRLHAQLSDLTAQFAPSPSNPNPSPSTTLTPNNPSLAPDFAAATSKPTRSTPTWRPTSKSVRFSDATDDDDENDDPNRASLFPYRDDPSSSPTPSPSHADLTNHQLHAYHARVVDEQDAQLDQLGASIGRQRELSMQIGDELDGHAVLLDDVEEGVDRHAAQFRRARGRLDRFGRKAKENWSLSVIVVLIVVLVLLIVITK